MIIFTDVDGTLYDYDGVLSASTKKAVKELKENGHKIIMVTGRSKAENKKELLDLGFDGYICGNGSYVELDDEVVFAQTISLEQCKRIVDWCHKKNIEFYEESNNGLFASEDFVEKAKPVLIKYMLGKGASLKDLEDIETKDVIHGLIEGADLYRGDLNKVSFILNDYEDLKEAEELFPDLNVGSWGGKGEEALFGDFGLKDIDKGKAIDLIFEKLNIDKDQAIGIGDAKVDIPMLKKCGIGTTFNSAGKEIKEVADYITDDVDKDGFYNAFRHFKLI